MSDHYHEYDPPRGDEVYVISGYWDCQDPEDEPEETAAVRAAQMDADWPQTETGPDLSRWNYPDRGWRDE